jgi:hypothetical protein
MAETPDPFDNLEEFENPRDTPVDELRTLNGDLLTEIARRLELRFSFTKKTEQPEQNILRISLVCRDDDRTAIIEYLCQLLKAEVVFSFEVTGQPLTGGISPGQVSAMITSNTAERINAQMATRQIVLVSGFENVISAEVTDSHEGWRMLHDFCQGLAADSEPFRVWANQLQGKEVIIMPVLTYHDSPNKNPRTAATFRSFSNNQFANEKIVLY